MRKASAVALAVGWRISEAASVRQVPGHAQEGPGAEDDEDLAPARQHLRKFDLQMCREVRPDWSDFFHDGVSGGLSDSSAAHTQPQTWSVQAMRAPPS